MNMRGNCWRPAATARSPKRLERAVASEQRNDKDEAETWRHIEAALKVMRGPSAS